MQVHEPLPVYGCNGYQLAIATPMQGTFRIFNQSHIDS